MRSLGKVEHKTSTASCSPLTPPLASKPPACKGQDLLTLDLFAEEVAIGVWIREHPKE